MTIVLGQYFAGLSSSVKQEKPSASWAFWIITTYYFVIPYYRSFLWTKTGKWMTTYYSVCPCLCCYCNITVACMSNPVTMPRYDNKHPGCLLFYSCAMLLKRLVCSIQHDHSMVLSDFNLSSVPTESYAELGTHRLSSANKIIKWSNKLWTAVTDMITTR